MLTNRINSLSASMTIAISTLAAELKAEGKDILSFSAGEPDFDTPQVIKDEAIKAINDGHTKYTAVDGTVAVKKAIQDKLKRENNLDYGLDNITVNVGAKHSLFNLFQAVIQEGDEVIIPAPYWVTYPELTKYSGGNVVEIHTTQENGFKITADELKNAITDKTKMLILTTPSNPTGAVYTKEELENLAKVLEGTNILVASDEMYEKLTYDVDFVSAAAISEDMYNRTITINGLSKSVAMTGWRFGYMASPKLDLMKAMKKLQSQSTSNINSITQQAAIAGLDGRANADIEMMKKEFIKRRDLAVDMFNKIDGLSVLKPDGAFYLFVNISKVSNDSMKFCSELLEKGLVAVVPGIAFGSEGFFRFSFATDEQSIIDGINRIENFVKSL
jgi:aspartate aminotransferase